MTPFILYLVKANALLLLLFVFYFLFLRKETFFAAIRYYFLLGITLSLALPLLSYTKTVYIEQMMDWSLFLNQGNPIPDEAVQQSLLEQLNIVALLPYIFGGISLIVGLLFAGKVFQLVRHIKRLQSWQTQVDIKVDHTSQEAYSFWNWIVLPANYKEIAGLETIVQHECIHVQEKHSIDLLLVQLVRRIFWFNPLLVLLERVVRLNLEYIVDQQVTALQNRYDYQMTLVQFEQTKITSLSLVNSFGSSDLKKRIIMLNQPKSKNMKKSKFVLCLPLAVGFFLLFQVHTKAEIRFVDQEITTAEQEPEKKQEASGTTVFTHHREELNTAQKETLDAVVQNAKEGVSSETTETNQAERGTIYVTTNDPSGKIKMTLNGKELTEEEHRLHTEKRMEEGKNQTYSFSGTANAKTRIIFNGKEYSMEDFAKLGKEVNGDDISYSYTIDREDLLRDAQRSKEEMKKTLDEAKKAMESSKKQMEESKKAMFESRKVMEESKELRARVLEESRKALAETREVREKALAESRKAMEQSRKDIEVSRKKMEKLRKQELDQIKDKLIIFNGKEVSLEELEKINPNGLGGGNINIYSTKESIEKYGDKGKNGVIVVTTDTNQRERMDAKGKTSNTVTYTTRQLNEELLLYVVDGKRIKSSEVSTIKSEEIESMNVLKGEMATAKYGKEGENGVIEIIKKK